jgi:hypothetical protein
MNLVNRDERELAIDLAADRLAYMVLAFGVLAIVAYRGFVLDQASWDLLALVVGTGFVGVGYRLWRRGASWSWALVLGITVAVAAFVAAALVFVGAR